MLPCFQSFENEQSEKWSDFTKLYIMLDESEIIEKAYYVAVQIKV